MNVSLSMTVSEWLRWSEDQLRTATISTAHLDCLVLLEDETGYDRAWLLAHSEYTLQGSEVNNLNKKIVQRTTHLPLAYIRRKAEFYGREFAVNPHTLVPRPETETMIEALKQTLNRNEGLYIIDVGTGSGALAVTAKLEAPTATVAATDIDPLCLETAHQNAESLGAAITFKQGNLLEPFGTTDMQVAHQVILLCNLPYVPNEFHINTAATHEPRHALFGGPDGLDLYRTLFAQIATNAWKPARILTESLPTQHEALAHIATTAAYKLQKTDDFIQLFVQA